MDDNIKKYFERTGQQYNSDTVNDFYETAYIVIKDVKKNGFDCNNCDTGTVEQVLRCTCCGKDY